jgi:hypothetical protein
LAESFVAKVKVTLIDPANASAISESQAMVLPVKQLAGGKCTIEPQSGALTGNACLPQEAQSAVINIDGKEYLDIEVHLTGSRSSTVQFSPTLYNGYNQQDSFQLSSNQHLINIGGTVTQTKTTSLLGNNTPIDDQQNVSYGIEVLYP